MDDDQQSDLGKQHGRGIGTDARHALGEALREAREARGWRQSDLAAASELSPRTIGSYEREGPPLRMVDKLDAVLDGGLRPAARRLGIALPPPRPRLSTVAAAASPD